MNLLFSIDDNYLKPLETTLFSIWVNNPEVAIDVYIIQKEELTENEALSHFIESMGMTYHPVVVGENVFDHAKISGRYPETIYYRLLAHLLLPQDLGKILYLDADILCINGLEELYSLELDNQYAYAAANHAKILKINNKINSVRLNAKTQDRYFNSGVLLMNLPVIRKLVKEEDIVDYLQNASFKLVLPDQDILNALYGEYIYEIPNEIYNVDMRIVRLYQLESLGEIDDEWMLENAVLLHFCGSDKPWSSKHATCSSYELLYKHYMIQKDKYLERI